MKKKSQLYFFAGLIFIISIFFITSNSKIIAKKNNNLIYAENYYYELKNVVNYAIFNNENITESITNYTNEFLNYINKKNINLGLAIIYKKENKILIINYLKKDLSYNNYNINYNKVFETEIKENEITNEKKITLNYNKIDYDFYFNESFPEIKCIFDIEQIIKIT